MNSKGYKHLRERLVKYFGIKMLLYIMECLDCPSLTVNGMGLRYGVCHQMIEEYYPNLKSGAYKSRLESKSRTVNGITEYTYVDGVISNITNFGIFVRLPNNESGLLHRSNYTQEIRFQYGKPLKVFIQRIYTENGRRKYDLSL